jgi:hypothetical protein
MTNQLNTAQLPKPITRYIQVFVFIAIYISIGFFLNNVYAYLFIGTPLGLLFQHFICKRPIHQAWLKNGKKFHLSKWGIAFAIFFCLYPIKLLVYRITNNLWDWYTLYWIADIIGAFPAAYCVSHLTKANTKQLLLCFLIAGSIGTAMVVAAFIGHGHNNLSPYMRLLKGVKNMLLIFPISFIIEEVIFRGVLDSYVYQEGNKKGVLSAFYISALWGLWHFPVQMNFSNIAQPINISIGMEVIRALGLIISMSLVGIPLSIFWRKSGNLAVPAFTHTFLDSVRNALLTIHLS